MPRITVPSAEEILGLYFPVLDHGFVALVDYMGGDTAVERAARVSYGAGTRKASETRGLIRYLKRHAHTSPFEMSEVTLHCCMPIFVARQWVRHRTASLNEESARYSVMSMVFYTPKREAVQLQSQDNKQGRAGEPVEEAAYLSMIDEWQQGREGSSRAYQRQLNQGVARELARIDLPLSTYTQWYWKIDLHNLMHFLRLRCDEHAQYEIRAYADVMAGILQRVAPLTYEAWVDYDLLGHRFSWQETAMLATGATFDNGHTERQVADQYGISVREVREYFHKLKQREPPNHSLDLTTAKAPSYFEGKFSEAVPG